MQAAQIFSLNCHASYTCRHSGACCAAGWAIPVEPARQSLLGAAILVPDGRGICRFYESGSRLCRVHREHGAAMLPEACHHFPRRARIDDRGVFVTLSHFCPTAAAALVGAAAPLEVVASPPAFPPGRGYDGLDARGAWPPLVKPDLLFDLDTYDRWERFVVSTLAGGGAHSTAAALQHIAVVGERLRQWRPETGTLGRWFEQESGRPASAAERDADWAPYLRFTRIDAYERVTAAVPRGLAAPELAAAVRDRWHEDGRASDFCEAVASRYVAAKAFASWSAYEAFGVRTMIAELVVADLVVRVEAARARRRGGEPSDPATAIAAVRAADWLLVHLVDRPALMAWLGSIDAPPANWRR